MFLASVSVRGDGECECGLVVQEGNRAHQLYILSNTLTLDTCRSYIPCHRFCAQQFLDKTNGGQLLQKFEDMETSLGDFLCGQLATRGLPHFPPSQVYVYMSMCHQDWEWVEERTREPLCCFHAHYASCRQLGAINTKIISTPDLRTSRDPPVHHEQRVISIQPVTPSPPQSQPPSVANI
ncbi:hypothetical protein Pcinc_001718 [Petrolisthes cinctipes]|uniref:Uncharacterized protein n=1 Tax=Petrolisthes cinctipes TaxID=88211 RepID=A0AAE1L4B1_PETCI|nr:hypothetical protein Pcinc_001718 [Petrolisthes cinctipes]